MSEKFVEDLKPTRPRQGNKGFYVTIKGEIIEFCRIGKVIQKLDEKNHFSYKTFKATEIHCNIIK